MPRFITKKIDKQVAFDRPGFDAAVNKYDRAVIEVRKYDPAREISLLQMGWLHCENGPISVMADHLGVSRLIAETILKVKCGEEWFIKDIDGREVVLSKTTLSITQTNKWFENIFDFCEKIKCPVPPPDKDWKLNKKKRKKANGVV